MAPHPTHLVVSGVDHFGRKNGPVSIPMEPQALLACAAEGGHFSYVRSPPHIRVGA